MGQIAWAVENMYFNTFLYNSVYNGASQTAVNGSIDVMDAISGMVAFSAVTAVVTTFIMGVLSDRVNNRKWFISIGYILWGIITACFGFITRDNMALRNPCYGYCNGLCNDVYGFNEQRFGV